MTHELYYIIKIQIEEFDNQQLPIGYSINYQYINNTHYISIISTYENFTENKLLTQLVK